MRIEWIPIATKHTPDPGTAGGSGEAREAALSLRVAPDQTGYIETVGQCLAEADELPLWRPVLIVIDGAAAGFAMYGLWREEGEDGRVWLDRFLIDHRYQGRGFARAAFPLLVERVAREYGCAAIYLSIHEGNDRAQRLYESAGFRLTGERDPKGELVMRRKV